MPKFYPFISAKQELFNKMSVAISSCKGNRTKKLVHLNFPKGASYTPPYLMDAIQVILVPIQLAENSRARGEDE